MRDSGLASGVFRPRASAITGIAAVIFFAVFSLEPAIQAEGLPYLQIEVPGLDGAVSPRVAQGGWPLSIEISMIDNGDLKGILNYNGIFPFPDYPRKLKDIDTIESRSIGFMLFSNPDGVQPADPDFPAENYCLSFLDKYFFPNDKKKLGPNKYVLMDDMLAKVNHPGCTFFNNKLEDDEEYLYFQIGQEAVVEEINWSDGPVGNPIPEAGSSKRMEGLVILSDSGIGNYYQPLFGTDSFVLDSDLKKRNLAAYVNSVGYALRNKDGKTSLTASMIAPRNLITPYIERDSDIGPTHAQNITWLRINGSQSVIELDHPSNSPLDTQLSNFLVTLRIFVVSGKAPESLQDLTGDSVVDFNDAEEAGYKILSEEKIITLRPYLPMFDGSRVDLDGNGAWGPIVAPAGAGGLTSIPD